MATLPGQEGFSFVLVLFVVLALLLGSLALANRSYFGVLGSAFQVQSREARSAAELGATYAIATLNQERNRPMLVTTATTNETTFAAPQTRWAAVPDSPCAPTVGGVVQPALNTSLDPDPATASYEEWYIQNGTTVTSKQPTGGNYRSFRIVGVRRPSQNGDTSTGNPATAGGLRIYRDRNYANLPSSGTQPLYLQVEGSSFRNGVRVATTTLEQEFEVVPKCCGRTFGGAHGNDVYDLANKVDNEVATCVPNSGLGYGLLAGAGPGDGQVTLNGTPNIESGTGVPIDPIFCLVDTTAADPSTCSISVKGNPSLPQVSLIDYDLGLPKTFTQATGVAASPLPLTQCSSATNCPSNSATTKATPTDTTFTKRATANICANGASVCDATNPAVISTGDTIVNVSSVSEANLPANCRKTPTGTVASGTVETIHCNITDLKPSGNQNIVFRTTPNRRISLYFPNPNTGNGANASIIDVSGNNAVRNLSCDPSDPAICSNPTLTQDPPYPVTTLSIFGCVSNGCGPQTVKLNGTPATLFTFIWLPYGTMDYRGTSDLAGVVWTENLSLSGTPTFTVSGSGIGDVLCQMGAVACNLNPTPSQNPPLFDWVARATNRFRFSGK